MISDVLSDAVSEIRRYQEEMPNCYAPIRDGINVLVEIMEEARRFLDAPDPQGEFLSGEFLRDLADQTDPMSLLPYWPCGEK